MNHMKLIPNIFIAVLMLLSAPAYTAQQGEYNTLETENQKSFKVYVASPMDASRGIQLIHGWLGLNQRNKKDTHIFLSPDELAWASGNKPILRFLIAWRTQT
ncbi:MAG: hypothetical protein ACN4GR_07595 [Arenicellales bacterium]